MMGMMGGFSKIENLWEKSKELHRVWEKASGGEEVIGELCGRERHAPVVIHMCKYLNAVLFRFCPKQLHLILPIHKSFVENDPPHLFFFSSCSWTSNKMIKLTQDQMNRRDTDLICAHWRTIIRCSHHKTRLKEMIKPGNFFILFRQRDNQFVRN